MSGRVAVVTGGTGAIGTEICKHLGAMGCRVVAVCRPATIDCKGKEWEAARREDGYEMKVIGCDLTDFDATREIIHWVEENIGPIDILVNAAGITRDAPLRKMTEDQWHQVLAANLDSVFNTTRNVIEGMTARGFGRIVNISSVNGQKGQFGQSNYAASKAAIHAFTMSIALEGARKGVTANTISPGYIDSPMIRAVPEEIRAKILEQIPVGRYGKPEEIGRAVAFIASDDSGFITGADLSINGGQYMR